MTDFCFVFRLMCGKCLTVDGWKARKLYADESGYSCVPVLIISRKSAFQVCRVGSRKYIDAESLEPDLDCHGYDMIE